MPPVGLKLTTLTITGFQFWCLEWCCAFLEVQHLSTSWESAWQPSCVLPHACQQGLLGVEITIDHVAAASRYEMWQMLYQLSYWSFSLMNSIESTESVGFEKIFFAQKAVFKPSTSCVTYKETQGQGNREELALFLLILLIRMT